MNSYKAAKNQASASFEERRSEFISHIKPVKTEAEAQAFISEVKSKYYDAKHNVFAYILNSAKIEKYSDDGEPQGTAGMPTLQVLKNEGLTDTVIVTTRYFGGILLGGGGLLRAYTKAAKLAVDAAGIAEYRLHTLFDVRYDYPFHSTFLRVIEKHDGAVQNCEYGQDINTCIAVLSENASKLADAVFEASNGTVKCNFKEECYF